MTTAALQDWPHKLVPAPRESTGAPVMTAQFDRFYDLLRRAGEDNANRNLAVIRGVGRVERAAARIEAHLAFDRLREIASQCGRAVGDSWDQLLRHSGWPH